MVDEESRRRQCTIHTSLPLKRHLFTSKLAQFTQRWSVLRRYSFFLLALCLSALAFSQTTPKSDSQSAATFQSNVRVVLLDVVVTDPSGAPVTGLTQDNFRVEEDGKQQKIASFVEHTGAPIKTVEPPKLPPNTYTNFPTVETADSINVILMDALNTQAPDQEFVHQQIIKYLKTIPAGARVAIFTLTSRLRLVQEFTTDSSRLLAALNDPSLTSPQASGLLKSKNQEQADQQIIDLAKLNQVGPVAEKTGTEEQVDPVNVLKEMLDEKNIAIDEQRVVTTMTAFQQLAHYLAGFPGRKNVIWVSGAFPIVIFPEANLPTPQVTQRSFMSEVQRTSDLCTAAQMAIYPVAAQGLANSSVYEADAAELSQERPSRMTQNNVGLMNREDTGRAGTRIVSEDLAKNTGGQAFHDVNGLGDVLKRVTNIGMHYYTISYAPTNAKMDGRYRQTRVEVPHQKYKLAYRRGYYALDAQIGAGATDTHNPLLPLMGFGLPDMSQLIFNLSVNPYEGKAATANGVAAVKGPTVTIGLDFGIALAGMKLAPQPDGTRRAQLEIRAIAYDDNGKPLNMTGQRGALNLTPPAFADALKTGVHLHLDLDVPAKSDVHLRTGVYDLNSGNAGTLGVRLKTEAK